MRTPEKNFPKMISLTITNACNLRCKMCGQWSENGYIKNNPSLLKNEIGIDLWKKVVDEAAIHKMPSILIRGGEPFSHPHIIELIKYINSKGIFTAIDTNGTMIGKYAHELASIGNLHLTVSIDGTEKVHDEVRGLKGTFELIRTNIKSVLDETAKSGKHIGISLNFTISPYSIKALGDLPDIARNFGVGEVCIVPYYYVPEKYGTVHEKEMMSKFDCPAKSWRGFHHEDSGITYDEFKLQHDRFLKNLGDIKSYPYMPLTQDEYKTWFTSYSDPVGSADCPNSMKLIDIQPDGRANSCVDFADYFFGNIKDSSVSELWNSEKALIFRQYRQEKSFPVCHRCGAKHMSANS